MENGLKGGSKNLLPAPLCVLAECSSLFDSVVLWARRTERKGFI